MKDGHPDLFSILDGAILPRTTAYARRSDPETSEAAAESIRPTELEAEVLASLKSFGEKGATTHELQARMGLERVTVSPRMAPLVRKGYAIQTDKRRPGPSGRSCIVFQAL